ncbi:YdcF family protein [Variovorax sp. PCZ-1]|uniref:YdcF family protein n=1 Tax=Variovorax sp. PCZ-1 TaxID=2835533 RepID=UPI001BCBC84F|nr:YdcF family protein [Variovorax sp. PCZ-1]MBS7807540.1 YdcF family protein [Variovorax sp. PCZ-1]
MLTEYAFLKPWLTTLVLPPGLPLLLILFAYLLVVRSERVLWTALGKMLFVVSFVSLWLFCSHGTAMFLERVALRPPLPIEPQSVTPTFKLDQVQAIVVLGGGIQSVSREYGKPALSESSAQRLHYGASLAKQTGLPLAFSGGIGWSSASEQETESAAAARWLSQLGLPALRYADSQSKDTAGNAQAIAAALKKDGIKSIALVTHASHMPRALKEFESTELKVLPAPTHFLQSEQGLGLDWFPSGHGLRNTRRVMHEILGMAILRRAQNS